MVPLHELVNDAHRNLVVSILISVSLDVPEVTIFIDNVLLRGNRTKKTDSGGLGAFESPNFPALARLETGIRFRASAVLPQPRGRFRVHRPLETNIAVWRMVPGFADEYIQNAIEHARGLRAIVLELYGTGNLSSRKASLIAALDRAIAKGIVIVATSQCTRGTVSLRTYELGRRLERIGVISAADMTTEAAVCKLAYLLSWPGMPDRERLTALMATPLRGEVTEQPLAVGSGAMPVHLHLQSAGGRGAGGGDGSGGRDVWIGMDSLAGASASRSHPGAASLQSISQLSSGSPAAPAAAAAAAAAGGAGAHAGARGQLERDGGCGTRTPTASSAGLEPGGQSGHGNKHTHSGGGGGGGGGDGDGSAAGGLGRSKL
jgi:hypothetical protein